jgi:diguanylate cyclase (GGDEF)-like protein
MMALLGGTGAVALSSVVAVAAGRAVAADAGSIAAWGMVGAAGAAAGALAREVADRKATGQIDEALHSARHDALTGLANRAELHRELQESLVRGTRDRTVVGVLFLDLNRFKLVNDTLGHEAGDDLLKAVAGRLRSTIRSTDLAARLGGDEFVVVCRDLIVADSVLNVASQLQRRFREPVSLGAALHEVGASIGIAIAGPGDGRTPEDLLRDADTAMYRAKKERLPYLVFEEAQRHPAMDRAVMAAELARALADDEFVVFYQPVIDVNRPALVGFEALVRWRHPSQGLIEPRELRRLADSVGLLAPVHRFVFRESCAQLAVWTHLDPEARRLRVSVNLAEQQLTDPNLALEIEELLAWSGLDAGQLMVEVPENMVARHVEDLDALRQVAKLGVGVVIDCFGTGGMSFRHAPSFDMVQTLKIDRSFVRELPHDRLARASVEAMVAMAGPLGLTVVADGVEEPAQMEMLRSLGVGQMQGYLFNAADYAGLVDPGCWFQASAEAQEVAVGLIPANVTPDRT